MKLVWVVWATREVVREDKTDVLLSGITVVICVAHKNGPRLVSTIFTAIQRLRISVVPRAPQTTQGVTLLLLCLAKQNDEQHDYSQQKISWCWHSPPSFWPRWLGSMWGIIR